MAYKESFWMACDSTDQLRAEYGPFHTRAEAEAEAGVVAALDRAKEFDAQNRGIECAQAVRDAREKAPVRAREALDKVLAIIAAHHLVADGVGDLANPRLQRRAALGRCKNSAFDLARPDHLAERTRGRNHLLDRGPAARAREIVGVLALGQERKAQALSGFQQRQREAMESDDES